MVQTESTMLELGTPAPDFALPETDTGELVRLSELEIKNGLLVAFISNHCPFVQHLRDELVSLGHECQDNGITMVAISSNSPGTHPADSPEKMAEEKAAAGYPFPYLFDEDQSVAKEYRAACTPDFYLFDGGRNLFYRGRFDDSTPKNGRPITGDDLRSAINAILSGDKPPQPQYPSIGCNIKWNPGNEPDYFG